MGDLLDELRDSISAARYSSASVLASLAVSIGLSVLLFVAFLILRRRIQTLYASKPHKSVKTWPYPGNGVFAWVKPVFQTKIAEELNARLGVDAVVFLKYLKMCRNMFLLMAIIGCGAGIPVNIYFNWKSPYALNLSHQDAFVLMTPTLLSGNPMIAHAIMGWALNIIVVVNLFLTYKWILKLRRDYYTDIKHRRLTENRTIMAVDVDKKNRTDNGLMRIAYSCDSDFKPVNASVGRSTKHLAELINDHYKAVLNLESAYLKRAKENKSGYTTAKMDDQVVYYGKLKSDLELRIEQERKQCCKESTPQGYGFISYAAQNQAHMIAQKAYKKSVEGSQLRLAPHPTDIIWDNLVLNVHERRGMRLWINFLYTCLLILWIIPVAALGCFLTNFKRIGSLWPAFNSAMEANTVGFAILQGVVAPFVTVIIFMLLPPVLRKMCDWEGCLTRTDREKQVMRKLFVLFFLVNFFVFTCMGVIWDVVAEVISIVRSGKDTSFDHVWEELKLSSRFATAVIDISSFWVMYLLRSITELFTSLAQVISLLTRGYQRAFTKFTPRDRMHWTEPQSFPYATTYIWTGFYTSIALGLTVIQPLVLAVTAVYFSLALPFKKYELMYMYYTKYESNGLFWPVMHNIILFSTTFGNLVLLCVIWVQGSWKIAMAVVPLPLLMIIYKVVSYFMFDRHYKFFVHASDSEKTLGDDEELTDIYENPLLSMPLTEPILDRPQGVKSSNHSDTIVEPIPYEEFKESFPEASAYGHGEPHMVPFNDYAETYSYNGYPQDDDGADARSLATYPEEVQPQQRQPFSPSCPYPEQAMFSQSTLSVNNYQSFQDDQNLLEEPPHRAPWYYGRME